MSPFPLPARKTPCQSEYNDAAPEVPGFCPERLTLIRERRGWTRSWLAKESDLAERSIRQYESGEAEPRASSLDKLADALRTPANFFFGEPIAGLGEHAASFRAATKLPAYRKRAALAAGSLATHFSHWIIDHFELPRVDVPDLPGMDPDLAADAARAAWGIGNRPVPNLVHLLESRGAMVFSLVEDCRDLDAFSFWSGGRAFVLLNTVKSAEHSRFDAAHELAHLVMHRTIAPTMQIHEEQAQRFAAAFLMPRAAVLASGLSNPSLSQVLRAKSQWGVAATALVRRLHELGMLGDWHYRTFMIELSKRGYRRSEPNGLPHERSQNLTTVLSVMRSEGRGLQAIATDLGISESDLKDLLFGFVPALSL